MLAPDQSWNTPPAHPTLSTAQVHVWRAPLDVPEVSTNRLRLVLAPAEQKRAEHFSRARDRKAFIVARGLLRVILSEYLSASPAELQFSENDYGKPFLAGAASTNDIHFNTSHSCGLALYGIARGRELGVDIEQVRTDIATDEIATCFFSSRELAADRPLPPDRRQITFFRRWTGKEAYIKALGRGLSVPLDQFDVHLNPQTDVMCLDTRETSPGPRGWSLVELDPFPGYVASLAVEGHGWSLLRWDWAQSPARGVFA
jgi:4'-phosphopantetheinyl transferase